MSRLRTELDLAILTFFGGVSAVVVAGFAIYRFLSGSLVGGLVDCGITLGLGSIVVFAWRTTDVRRAGAVFVGFAAMACIASSLVFGRTASYWAFVVLSVSFVVTGPRTALVGSLVLIAAIAGQSALFSTVPEQAIFVVTALLVAYYGWVFNTRYTAQREALEELAHSDPLTRTGNRRALRRDLTEAVKRADRDATPAVLAVLDLDHFKTINDRFGHEVGDRVLADFADLVRERLRHDDGFYRLGGEEFVVLLRGTEISDGRAVIDELHQLVGVGMQTRSIPVTVSVGVAGLERGDDWSSWLRRADEAMYEAKARGRDRVIVDSETARRDGPQDQA